MARVLRLRHYLRGHAWAVFLIFLSTLAASLCAVLQPWPLKLIIDHLLGKAPLPPGVEAWLRWIIPGLEPSRILVSLIAAGFLLFLGAAALDAYLTWLWTRAGRRMVNRLSEDLLDHLQSRSLLFHSQNQVGELMSRVTGDSWCVYRLVDDLFLAPLHAILLIVGMLFLMWPLNHLLATVAMVLAPAVVLASMAVGKPLRRAVQERREMEGAIQAHLQQTLNGLPVVQSFTREEQTRARFDSYARSAIRAQQRSTLLGGLNQLFSGLTATLGTGLILGLGAREVLENRLSIGGLLVFLAYLGSLQAQIKALAGFYTAWQGARVSMNRIQSVLDQPPEIRDHPGARPLPSVSGGIQFDQVAFGYRPDAPVLRDVDLTIPPGQTVAILGPTGAGKSTLIRLIPRLADPSSGRVLLDGVDLRAATLRSVRAAVSMLHQEPYLWPRSIAENIACGRPGASAKEIEEAAQAANAHEFIQRLPQGYDTRVGERGGTLSGGERQRVAMARAFLKNAPILLLDEPTSALDPGTEHAVIEAMSRLMRGRTTLLITHRLSTVAHADRIVVLEGGRVVEDGTPRALLAAGGRYARVHGLQTWPDELKPAIGS